MNENTFIRSKVDLAPLLGRRVLVTGASGFFGQHISRALTGKCLLSLAWRENYFTMLKGEYDYILHLAPVPIEPVIECAKQNMATVLYTSSGAVYGGMKQNCRETDPTFPKTDYGREKLRSEFVLKESGLDYRICRLFAFCGQGMRDYFAITAFVNAVKNNKPLVLFGGGMSIRSYLYIADAVAWMLNILLYGGRGIYNVGSERQISIKDLARMIADTRMPPAEIIEDKREFHDPAPYYVPNCSKAHAFGLFQWHDLEYGVKRMLND